MSEFIIRSVKTDEYALLCDYVATIFAEDNPRQYERLLYYWLNRQPQKPGFKLEQCRVGVLDGHIVTHALVHEHILSYGQARLRIGGIGAVFTLPDYQRRGYAAAVMRDALAYLAEQGAHLALLHGINHYYSRFGFNSVWPHYTMTVKSADAAQLDTPLYIREAEYDDVPQMAALYDKHWRGRVSFYRHHHYWLWRVIGDEPPAQVVVQLDGRVVGYMRGIFVGDRLAQLREEVVVDSPAAAMTFLAHHGRMATAQGIDELTWYVPPDDALITYARQWLPVTVSAHYQPHGGWMARVLDTNALVEQILPELIAQAQMLSPFNGADLRFDVTTDGISIGLRSQPDLRITLDQHDFVPLLFGSVRPTELAARDLVPPSAVPLLERLFPPRMAALGGWDWY